VIVVSLLLLGVGSIGAAYVQSLWHVCVTTGFFMALGAALAGWIYEWTGGYEIAFVSAALMGFIAAGLALAIREEPMISRPTPTPTPAPAVS